MKSGRRSVLILLVLLVLPMTIYLIFRSVSRPVFKSVPYEYVQTVTGDSVIPQIGTFNLMTPNGQSLSQEDLLGKLYIIDFFSLKDTLLTKVLHGNLVRLYNNISDTEYIGMLSVYTGDSMTYGLKTYTEDFEQYGDIWKFAWGNREGVISLGAEQLGIQEVIQKWDSISKLNPQFAFTSQTVALIDKAGKVRGYYEATDLAEIKKLNEDIRALTVLEYPEELNSNKLEPTP